MDALRRGDKVALWCPATAVTNKQLESCVAYVESLGLVPILPNTATTPDLLKCAGTDNKRYEQLEYYLQDPSIPAIWCVNGGYGTSQLLTQLRSAKKPQSQTLLIGYSDITVLLNIMAQRWGFTSLHGPMLVQMTGGGITDTAKKLMEDVVLGRIKELNISLQPYNETADQIRTIKAPLFGGCLSLIQTLLGTQEMPDLQGAVLLIEDDRFETPQRIDRMLDHLARTSELDNLQAVILGKCLEKEPDEILNSVFTRFGKLLNNKNIPLFYTPDLGHTETMKPVLIGKDITIKDTMLHIHY